MKPPASESKPKNPRTNGRKRDLDLAHRNVEIIRKLEEADMARRTTSDRIAAGIARFCGTVTFVWVHLVIFAAWLAYNTLPWFEAFDPYPFTFLTLVVSLEAIFLSTFILISQNYDMRVSERRNQLDLQVNLLAEQETTKALQLLERIASKVGAQVDYDPVAHALEKTTRPDALARKIEEAYQRSEKKPSTK